MSNRRRVNRTRHAAAPSANPAAPGGVGELRQLSPPGRFYEMWVTPKRSPSAAEAATLSESALTLLRKAEELARWYGGAVPHAAIILDELLANDAAGIPAALFGMDRGERREAVHQLHASGWVIITDDAAVRAVQPAERELWAQVAAGSAS